MTELAAIVLAHADPVHLKRLVRALPDVPIFLHCDARMPPAMVGEMTRGLPDRVTLTERFPTGLASWWLVEAELAALRRTVQACDADHIAVLSGADYPLVSVPELVDQLRPWAGLSFFRNVPIPFPQWNTRSHQDGGLWRLRYRFITRHGQPVFWRHIPLHWPWKRTVPADLEPRAASHWKIYSRQHVEMLLRAVHARPDLVRFWRSTHVPEESFAASMLGSRALFGSDAMPPCLAHPWYLAWPAGGAHPQWLTSADFDRLAEARWAQPIAPDEAVGVPGHHTLQHRRLFARKFSTQVDTEVLDRIDDELRQ